MFRLITRRWRAAHQPAAIPKPRSLARSKKPAVSAAERRRLADTDGTLRRMRQTVEDNRLL